MSYGTFFLLVIKTQEKKRDRQRLPTSPDLSGERMSPAFFLL
jgi:hypothetical protein